VSRNYLVIALAVAAMVAVPARPAHAIAHGDRVPAGKYAFATKLTMTGIPTGDGGDRDSWCSGALIAPRWVITAGHCFRDADGKRVSRTVAEHTTAVTGGGHSAEVVRAYQAPDHDVALAELATPITAVTPIRLGDAPPKAGDLLRLIGYGLTGDDSGSSAPRTGVFVVGQVRDTLLDVSGRKPQADTSACRYDSGGPYFTESRTGVPTLVAVVSTGPECPHPGPDFAARTDQLGDWIAATTGPGSRSHAMTLGLLIPAVLLVPAVAWVVRRRAAAAPRSLGKNRRHEL